MIFSKNQICFMVTINWLNLTLEKATIVHAVNFSFVFFSRFLVFLEGKQKYLSFRTSLSS